MFEILLLLAAGAFSGHEVAANVDSPPAAHSTAEMPAAAPAADMTAPRPVIRVADETAPSAAGDPEAAAALDRISDFYDTTPPASPAPQKRHSATAAPASPAPPSPTRPALGPHLARSSQTYTSEGQPVVIEILRPDDDDRRPAVLILHGASGIGDGTFYRGAAEIFAERGYVTFLPHYLAAARAMGTAQVRRGKAGKAAKTRATDKRPPEGSIRAGFSRQEQILRDAVDYIAANPYVDPTRIGVFGLSLGGFHALTLSSRDERIAAVVDMSGALRGNVVPASNHLAPTLELHGAHDPIVPVARARALAATLDRLGVPHELKIYPAQGHFLRGKAQEDALLRAASFFGTYLTPSDTSRAARSSDGVD